MPASLAILTRLAVPAGAAAFDATDGGAVTGFFETAGPVDHLVLAASPGAVGSGPFAGLTEDALRQAFDGKFFAHVKVLRAARPRLRADGSLTIVSAASARAAYPGAAGLAAVNGALEAMVPTLAVELGPAARERRVARRHRHPVVERPAGRPAGRLLRRGAGGQAGRVGTAEDAAAAIVYLAGAGFVTGTVLECAGGANLTVGAVAG
jgi:NAD(P)-dependent dehydrogenase (short-subunit alcohol dehydrogenase family)